MGRREITDRATIEDAFTYAAYVADALALAGEDGDKEVGALRPSIEKVLTRGEALATERRNRRRAIGKAHALVRRRDQILDEATTNIHNDALALVRQDRQSPLFSHLFPAPLSQVVRLALESQLPEARLLMHKLLGEETPPALRKAHEKRFAQVIDWGEQAVKGREEAFAEAARTTARVQAWRDDINQLLLGIEGALKNIAAHRNLKGDWVDGFFPVTPTRPRSGSAGDGTVAPTSVQGGAAARNGGDT